MFASISKMSFYSIILTITMHIANVHSVDILFVGLQISFSSCSDPFSTWLDNAKNQSVAFSLCSILELLIFHTMSLNKIIIDVGVCLFFSAFPFKHALSSDFYRPLWTHFSIFFCEVCPFMVIQQFVAHARLPFQLWLLCKIVCFPCNVIPLDLQSVGLLTTFSFFFSRSLPFTVLSYMLL